MNRLLFSMFVLLVATSLPNSILAQQGQRGGHGPGFGSGRGPGGGQGMGRGMGLGPNAMAGMQEDMTTLHSMFANRAKIKRTVTNLPDGAETLTESDDERIASMIRAHVPAMEDRVLANTPLPPMTFHPIFVALIKHADDYSLTYEETAKGMKVRYTSEDPYVVMLVQEHAKLVSRFIKNGMQEIHRPYTLPKLTPPSGDPKGDRGGQALMSRKRKMVAEQAKDALFAKLSARLAEVMQSSGAAAAIDVCSNEALKIAGTIGEEHGVSIGRTSFKLRNPANRPRDWVKPFVDKRSDTPQFLPLDNGNLGALFPIHLKVKCLMCHGHPDDILDEVKSELTKRYPNDEATGFKLDELRGWFWVEVPATDAVL